MEVNFRRYSYLVLLNCNEIILTSSLLNIFLPTRFHVIFLNVRKFLLHFCSDTGYIFYRIENTNNLLCDCRHLATWKLTTQSKSVRNIPTQTYHLIEFILHILIYSNFRWKMPSNCWVNHNMYVPKKKLCKQQKIAGKMCAQCWWNKRRNQLSSGDFTILAWNYSKTKNYHS